MDRFISLFSWCYGRIRSGLQGVFGAGTPPAVTGAQPPVETPKAEIPQFSANQELLLAAITKEKIARYSYADEKAKIHWYEVSGDSLWGSLGKHKAAILPFEIVFDHPEGYELKSAEFRVMVLSGKGHHSSPQVTSCILDMFRATTHGVNIEVNDELKPNINIGPYGGFSGFGRAKTKAMMLARPCWSMKGIPDRAVAKWNFEGCRLAPADHRPHHIRIGVVVRFAGEHHDVSIKVDLKGVLESTRKRMLYSSAMTADPGRNDVWVVRRCSHVDDLAKRHKDFLDQARNINMQDVVQ